MWSGMVSGGMLWDSGECVRICCWDQIGWGRCTYTVLVLKQAPAFTVGRRLVSETECLLGAAGTSGMLQAGSSARWELLG